jgi:hypothetical protein
MYLLDIFHLCPIKFNRLHGIFPYLYTVSDFGTQAM